ncbi:hypothetical protein MDG893_01250 [Marinobacter algicola DG893]|uniref:Uncharacterized protein n=2 Tax=Marinobacter algicola TaxID=236100 RepID=A6F1J0_9GAMM|nr:hypothetical protein MDG893_01250 [Marinobacter algicola DG893]
MLLSLVSGVLLARTLGPENYGTYSFALSVIALLSLPVKAGLPTLLVREIATNQLIERWGLIQGLLRFSNGVALAFSVLVAALATLWFSWRGDVDASIFLWGVWLLPLMALEAVRAGILRGMRWILSAQVPEKLVRPFVLILMLGTGLFLGWELTALAAMQFQLIAAFVAFVIGSALLSKALPGNVRRATPEYALKPWIASLVPLTLFVGLKLLDSQVAVLFLGILATAEEVGLFRVAATGAGLVAIGLLAVNMAMAPQIARLYKAGEMKKLQKVITFSTRAVSVISFPIAIIFIVWGEWVISFVFGEEYAEAATALAILCIGQLVNTSAGSVGLVLNMTGNDKLTFVGATIALVTNSILGLILIPLFGLNGAAISFSLSISVWNIFLFIMVKWKVGINTFFVYW